ncbi:hypothetical protein AB0C04_15020 [Micromonospora sp. NPDC048909]|uniref:hypothetical protein n=1 Tax=Micromonospora sp. NPDC048909 TaxID=3155643 RepID=UPI0033EB6FBF
MVPDYRHASPPPIADGQTVTRPPRPLPLATRTVWVCAGLVLVLMAAGIAGLFR